MGDHYYGPGHPMNPKRLGLATELVLSYGLDRKMTMVRPRPASTQELTVYHDEDYVKFIERVSPSIILTPMSWMMNHHESQTQSQTQTQLSWVMSSADQQVAARYNVGEQTDCPLFDGLYDFCRLSCGGSLEGARRINAGMSDICINWSGGLHHAKKAEASGFCYMNDIILAILELLRFHARVLYIDIDIHHGDGVEEAFYSTDRVMTLSFHKYGDFFPGTGDIADIGSGAGEKYSVNFPLKSGLDDPSFERIFKPVLDKIMLVYDPSVIVLQCGADSLAGDRLGVFDLSVEGHAACVRYVKSFGKPMLVLGGGGYTISNVARCWAYETAVLLGCENEIPNQIPPFDGYYDYYAPSYTLQGLSLHRSAADYQALSAQALAGALSFGSDIIGAGNNAARAGGTTGLSASSGGYSTDPVNTREFLETSTNKILKTLNGIQGAPSVAIQTVPPSWIKFADEDFSMEQEEREIARGKDERATTRELRALGR